MAVAGTLAARRRAAVKFGLDVRNINKDLDQFRRFPAPARPTGLCDSKGQSAQPLTAAQRGDSPSKTDQGNRDETLQWVFVGVGGAFAIASGYLLYKGYLVQRQRQQHASNHGLRLFPTATASAAGVVAEFDF